MPQVVEAHLPNNTISERSDGVAMRRGLHPRIVRCTWWWCNSTVADEDALANTIRAKNHQHVMLRATAPRVEQWSKAWIEVSNVPVLEEHKPIGRLTVSLHLLIIWILRQQTQR